MFLHQTLPHLLAPLAIQNITTVDIRKDSSDGENEWSSSNEHASSVVCGSQSITLKSHSFKSITKSSFDVSRQLVSGHSMIGPVVNLPLAAPPRGDG
jgi:hypothetical protein